MKEEIKYKEEIDRKMSKMNEMPAVQPALPAQTTPPMTQPGQMSQPIYMPQPAQMPQMFPMAQVPVVCCPFLMNMHCPIIHHGAAVGMGQMTTYPYGASPYFNHGMGGQYMNGCNCY